ncbi:hypothetical protein [Acinetobacter bereziniae]|uniref:hypothetical protein n=1 Tax=Acinetobacter bereziniae TaxID=106648 RepID=UPI00124FB2E6|nr:hypothetical protein [Acinetobacter bereziniae]MBJ9902310.1 hypothetical protein [Acinetobacter bereziniae]MCU4321471.1 hypothetical protein [Acinetobacter bereziniae]MCU4600481.1 hypothetical protein [Acinetobacter bereziniae]MCV2443500.1 hypothetical protein [Acinetobacter bereziniae]
MDKLSYNDLRLGVLDDFYQEMLNYGHQYNAQYETVLGHLIYEYEEGFSNVEIIIIEFVIYAIAGKFVSEKVSKRLRDDLVDKLNTVEFKLLLNVLSFEDKTNFLHDLLLLNFIDEDTRNHLTGS